MKSTDNSIRFHNERDDRHIVLKYFCLIDKKDMPSLLDLFTEDCTIYEPFSRDFLSDEGKGKKPLKGRNEIESFFHVVMMASDGLKHEIEFINSPIKHTRQNGDTVITTSSSIVSALTTFYRNEGGDKLKQKFVFHIVSEQQDTLDNITRYSNDKDINSDTRKIERLYVCNFSG